MRRRMKCLLATLLLALGLLLPEFSMDAVAYGDPMIVVSLGDSYSSGEGIEPFYGQDKPWDERVRDLDWLAHRSQLSWPGQIQIPGYSGSMKDYRQTEASTADCQWYFAASSGAVSSNVYLTTQNKEAHKMIQQTYPGMLGNFMVTYYNSVDLPKQIEIFDKIEGGVDYVTMSIGGNDVGFADIITTCVTGSTYLGSEKLSDQMEALWADIEFTKLGLKNAYEAIEMKAGPQAAIIIAGYPKLLEKEGKGWAISREEATTVNKNVTLFNNTISDLIAQCRADGMNIHFVSVEDAFDANGGHQAYSDDPWINEVILGTKSQDLKTVAVSSAYSIHPNARGAQAYAECVNAKIAEIENAKKTGTLSGTICEASDRTTPVRYTDINIYRNDGSYAYRASGDANGYYSLTMEEGDYKVDIDALGYIPFTAYATVTQSENTYMETFLLVEGEVGEQGKATGTITNALTGRGVSDATIEVRDGWNNLDKGSVIATTSTGSSGAYSLTLPLGNYTLAVSKDGFITGAVNIIVQRGTTANQNGSITPLISGEDYRIVLTWGADPRDLDSHMVGSLENGNSFHVYYSRKSQYDGSIEVCNLDVDDTSGYGPETVTLKATSNNPYYYYIYHFSGNGTVATSEATIKVYQGSELVAKFNVPTDQGSGRYWNVFAIVDGQLVTKNTITSSPDTNYASSPVSTFALRRESSYASVSSGDSVDTCMTVSSGDIEMISASEMREGTEPKDGM